LLGFFVATNVATFLQGFRYNRGIWTVILTPIQSCLRYIARTIELLFGWGIVKSKSFVLAASDAIKESKQIQRPAYLNFKARVQNALVPEILTE